MASGKVDEPKGRVKEAAGALTDDKKLKQEGQGEIKQKLEKVIDTVKDAIGRVALCVDPAIAAHGSGRGLLGR